MWLGGVKGKNPDYWDGQIEKKNSFIPASRVPFFPDPYLGRPLQPNPAGGIPAAPQSLNRYAATPLGSPGVAETVANGGYGWLFDAFDLVQSAAFHNIGESQRIIGYTYSRTIRITVKAKKTRLNKKLLSNPEYNFSDLISAGDRFYQTSATFLLRGRTKAELDAAAQATVRRVRATLDYKRQPPGVAVTDEILDETPLPVTKKFIEFADFKFWKRAIGPGLDIAIGGYLQYLDDVDNPFLTGGQRLTRVAISGAGSWAIGYGIGQGLAYLGCVSTVWCGIGAGILTIGIWVITDPTESLVPQKNRSLQPLN